ncbi:MULTISPECIES: plasmid mobilization protein [Actinomycetes]|uniref:plasmid mobilization protein n=1 Tax=Actinomycetes TaxID=1760 RepID=UPI0026D34721
MERLTSPIRDLRQRPGFPSPGGRAATEDEGQRLLEDRGASRVSDKNPAGRLPYAPENEPDSPSSAGRDRAEGCAEDPALSAEQHHDSQVNTGRGAAQRAGSAEAPVEPRNSRRREVSLDVRLTVADRDAIRHRAHVLSVKPSAWARAVMLDALDSRSSKVAQLESNAGVKETAPTSLAPAVEQLRRVGVNLNQALRKGAAVDDGLLHAVMVAVDEVRASLGDRTRS